MCMYVDCCKSTEQDVNTEQLMEFERAGTETYLREEERKDINLQNVNIPASLSISSDNFHPPREGV